MEIWKYILVLRQPNNSWVSSVDSTEAKLNALTTIAIEGYPSLISNLTEFLRDDNKQIRDTTCRTITYLFKRIDSKTGYYESLKYCGISIRDIEFYETNFPKEQFIELLVISSLNRDGYVREQAVNKLAQIESPRAIQFLIYRLADWVIQVRQAALRGIANYKTTDYIDSLIENLPIFAWLQQVERTDLSGVYQDIVDFIASTNRSHVITNFTKYPDKQRLLIAKHISNSLRNYEQELKLLLEDKHFLIRMLVIDHLDKLGQTEVSQLLHDKSAKVRLLSLYCLKNQEDFETTVTKFLADTSATIRHFARFSLNKSNVEFAQLYNDNLQRNHQVIGSLGGLAETGIKEYSVTVKSYLYNNSIRVIKSAFSALCKLDQESAYEFAIANLDSPYPGLRNSIIEYLSRIPRQEMLLRSREIYRTGNYDLKISMLKLFNTIGSWATIPDLLIGTIDENENIRQLAAVYVQIWKARAVRRFTTPSQAEIERAKQIFRFVNETHEEKHYFVTNPVNDLDFYLKY